MNQLEALNIAYDVLSSRASGGDDECGEAAAKINEIIKQHHRRKARRGIRKKAWKLAMEHHNPSVEADAETDLRRSL